MDQGPREIEFEPQTQKWLEGFIVEQGAIAGTVHRVSHHNKKLLELVAAVNIPRPVLAATSMIPAGKGMAGLALSRAEPVSTCNLKADDTGDVRPGAKAVNAQAAVAMPIRDDEGEIAAVVGIAYTAERDLGASFIGTLTRAAATLPAAESSSAAQ